VTNLNNELQQVAIVSAVLSAGFSHARYRYGNRTPSTRMGDTAIVGFSQAKRCNSTTAKLQEVFSYQFSVISNNGWQGER
jgi:hypothetical protein